jgi:F420-dependent oxidoreductase-like protein
MRFALMIEAQQGLSYDDQLAVVRTAEESGFESFFRSDHYSSFPGRDDTTTTDAWTVLGGLARETNRISLGVLVSPVTFRHPGHFAKATTTVDHMSGGRIEVGLGAGWNEVEHKRYAFPFPEIGERADILEEQLAILHGLWTEPDGWSFHGRHYRVEDALFRPKPLAAPGRPVVNGQARPRIIVGGGGSPRSMRIAARYADEFNVTSANPDQVREKYAGLAEACERQGRDAGSITRSAMIGVMVGADDDEVTRRTGTLMAALDVEAGSDGGAWFEERRRRWIMGTPDEARATVQRYAEAGVERIMLQDFLPHDLAMIELLGRELVGRV